MTKTRLLTRGAIAVAMGVILSFIVLYRLPNGGSITAVSLAPILIFSLLYKTRGGLAVSLTYSLLQMLLGFYPPPTPGLGWFILVVLLDYVLAFGVLGLAWALGKPFGKYAAAAGSGIAMALRFLCHFVSGILIWGAYAPEGQPVWLYSLLYNGSYMLIELVLTLVVIVLLQKTGVLERMRGE